jgi:hypothetical protein
MDKYSSYTDNPDNDCDQDASWNDGICDQQNHEDHSVEHDNHRNGYVLHVVNSHRVCYFYYAGNGNFLHW